MSAVTPEDIKKVRQQTGAGIGDCKKALVEAGGDFKEAVTILRKRGLADAAERSNRHAGEGAVFSAQNDSYACMIEVRCETDFVAMNLEFRKLGEQIARTVLENRLTEPNEELRKQLSEGVLLLKENLVLGTIKGFPIGSDENLSSYSHNNGQIGVLLKLRTSGGARPEELDGLGHDIALHIAACQPEFLNVDQIGEGYLNEQREIFTELAVKEGIPEKVKEGYIKGKLKKHFASCCLLEQGFVKDEKKTIRNLLKEFASKHGIELTISDYLFSKVSS